MTREEILQTLSDHRQELRRDFGVESLALFGSAARGAIRTNDVDILVDIPSPISLFRLVALQERLQDLLDVPRVDVVMRDAILPPLRETILAEAISVG